MATLECDIMDRKTISVSKKRQITIPLQFYKHLDLDNEVECSLEDGAIVIRPVHRGTSEFSVEILKDLTPAEMKEVREVLEDKTKWHRFQQTFRFADSQDAEKLRKKLER